MVAVGCDILKGGAPHDLSTCRGMLHAISLTLRLKPRGLLFGGLPCNTWALSLPKQLLRRAWDGCDAVASCAVIPFLRQRAS